MQFLDFEKPLEDLQKQLDKLNEMAESSHTDMSAAIREIEAAIEKTRASIYQNLSPWQRVQLSRHPERPYTQFYIESIFENFTELFGDRQVKDDKAIVAG
ncbi:MAG: acetyl-CoA carboxylase carboxyl transferase subunit alpha, partial [Bacteroidota bacterium]